MRWFIGIVVAVAAVLGIGFYLLSAPDIPRATLEAKYATPPSQFVDVAYTSTLPNAAASSAPARAHYRIRGAADAPTILLLHGSNASLFTWEPWSNTLSDHFRVVSVDLPGHGLTGATPNHDYTQAGMANFVLAFADKLGLKTFALGGNSMGGGVAARFAEEHPDRVSALILVDAGGMPSKQGDSPPIAFRLLRMTWLRPVLNHLDPTPLVREGLGDAIVRKQILTPAMIKQYADFARMAGARQATAERFSQYSPADNSYVKDHIGVLTMPVLILWGEKDHLIPVATAATWHDAIPGSKVIIYADTGHIPMEEVADQSAKDVRKFLTKDEAPPSVPSRRQRTHA
ncbi:MAG TPA: alpha/beta hydrolase [Rhizomicrobium sp.]|nr:alpha/beta hydrolase [Rhizomicrobium sp.]